MPDTQQVIHIQENGKYRIKIEKAAGVKTGDGFTVEACGDGIEDTMQDAWTLYNNAKKITAPSIPTVGEAK